MGHQTRERVGGSGVSVVSDPESVALVRSAQPKKNLPTLSKDEESADKASFSHTQRLTRSLIVRTRN